MATGWRWWSRETPLPSLSAPYRALLPRKAMQELVKLAERCGRRRRCCDFSGDENHLFFQIGERLLISPQADGQFSGLRARASEGSAEHR